MELIQQKQFSLSDSTERNLNLGQNAKMNNLRILAAEQEIGQKQQDADKKQEMNALYKLAADGDPRASKQLSMAAPEAYKGLQGYQTYQIKRGAQLANSVLVAPAPIKGEIYKRIIEEYQAEFGVNPDMPAEWSVGDQGAEGYLKSIVARAREVEDVAKEQAPNSGMGKIAKDLQQGLLTQTQADSAMRKETQLSDSGVRAGGSTGVLVDRYMKDNPSASFSDALYVVQTGFRSGTRSEGGEVSPIKGVVESKGAMEYEISRQKEIGKNTPSITRGQARIGTILDTLESNYNKLDKMEAIVSTERSAGSNILASSGSSGLGQAIGKMSGSQTQSIRNQINAQRPVLLSAIKEATGMSAKQLDSNAELKFYLQMATDPKLDIQANKEGLKFIKEWVSSSQKSENATGGSQITRPAVGAIKNGYEFLGGDPSSQQSWRKR